MATQQRQTFSFINNPDFAAANFTQTEPLSIQAVLGIASHESDELRELLMCDPELRSSYLKHRQYQRELSRLGLFADHSADASVHKAELKKLKLLEKDRMASLIRRHTEAGH